VTHARSSSALFAPLGWPRSDGGPRLRVHPQTRFVARADDALQTETDTEAREVIATEANFRPLRESRNEAHVNESDPWARS
jgi:hypothetical protein